MKRFVVIVGLFLVALGLLGVSSAATLPLAGSLDPAFGSGGMVTARAGGGIGGITVQPDGKIVVAGTTKGEEFLLARYLPNGSADPSFGDGGYVVTRVGEWAFANAIDLQPDGKIVVAGGSYQKNTSGILGEFTLARYNPNGSLDASFGNAGITSTVIPEQPDDPTTPTPESAEALALAVLPRGDILAAGSSSWNGIKFSKASFALARYTPDGSLDPTFGGDGGGIVQTASPGTGVAIAVRPNGEIVATEGDSLIGYAPNGSLNTAFDPNPKQQYVGAVTLQKRKIVVAGVPPARRSSNWFLAVTRYKTNGRLDVTFGLHGYTEIKRVVGLPTAILAQRDGKLLIASGRNGPGRFAVVRLLPNGRLDSHFGSRGFVWFGDAVSALASQLDGKVLVGGGANDYALDRLIGGNNCVVPGLRDKTVSKASAALKKSYCRRGHISTRYSSKIMPGRVITTAPPRRARLPGGAKVDLVVSKRDRP